MAGGFLSIAFYDFNCFYRRSRARQAGGRRTGGRDARASTQQTKIFFLLGLMKLVGLKALIFFFLFRLLFLNITGFSRVLLSCGLHSTGFVLLRFFFGLVLFTSECSVGTFPNVPLNL